MATYQITAPDGQKYKVSAPDDASQEEVLAYAQRSFKMAAAPKPEAVSKPFGQQLNEVIADAPRTLGRGARAVTEGLGNTFDFLTSPIRGAANSVLANSQDQINRFSDDKREPFQFRSGVGPALADAIGLPKPQNADERIADSAISTIAGGAIPVGIGAQLAARGTGAARGVGQALAAKPALQGLSAGSAGAAGQYTKETGGNDVAQFVAALGAGVAAPAAASGIASAARGVAARSAASRAPVTAQVDVQINNSLRDSGINLADLPAEVAAGIRSDVQQALNTGQGLNPDAVRRLADYRLTGLTPTRAKLTQDVADITRQANLAKLGANSSDEAAQQLAQVQNLNNRALTTGLNDLGAAGAGDRIAGGRRVMDALQARDQQAQGIIGRYYNEARATDGRSAMLDPSAFTNAANNALDQALLGGALPADIRTLLNNTASGKMPLTVDVAEQFKTRLAEAGRDAMARGERSTAKAVGLVRSALEDAPLQPGQEIGQQAIDAFGAGRLANREYMALVERTPALKAVRDGVAPDKFVNDYIIGSGNKSNFMDVAALKSAIKNKPDAMGAVREQMLAYLKDKALSGAADEVGNFSQSAYRNALKSIGDRKLALFFSPQDLNQLKALGRVASYEQFQPAGSAVNNSNTAGAVGNILERLGGAAILNKIPFGRAAIGEPLQNISLGIQAGRAMNAPQALLGGPQLIPDNISRLTAPQSSGLGLSPAAILGAQETPEQRRRRELGLPPRP